MNRSQLASLALALTASLAIARAPPAAKKAEKFAPPGPLVEVPYRLTGTQHVMVRVKIDGKGPFNFIVDTGSPLMFMASKPAAKAGLKLDDNGWADIDKLTLEGGLEIPAARLKVEDLFQLEGMNGIGIAGVELHGVLGYNILARYKVHYDFKKDKLGFQELEFEPKQMAMRGKTGGAPGGLDAIGGIVKFMGAFMGMKNNLLTEPRGFLGVRLGDDADKISVASVLPGSPAAAAELKVGDVITHVGDEELDDRATFERRLAKLAADKPLTITLTRNGTALTKTITLGKGL